MRAKIQKTRYLQLPATNFFVPLQYENRNYCGNGQRVYAAQVHSRTYGNGVSQPQGVCAWKGWRQGNSVAEVRHW